MPNPAPRPGGSAAPDGKRVRETVEVTYGLGSDLWVQFAAKVAPGSAAKLLDDEWLDSRLARAPQSLLWHGPIDNAIWPTSVPGFPEDLSDDHILGHCLGAYQHLIGFIRPATIPPPLSPSSCWWRARLNASLPGLECGGAGRVWVIDWSTQAVPACEEYDAAVERLLRDCGWSDAQIDAVRLP
ncbi:MAG: hypothetical protein ACLP0J_11470 [Solirubrobacteraceae bacterium]